MLKKIMLATVTSVFLLLSVAVHAEPITIVVSCELKDGSTKEDALRSYTMVTIGEFIYLRIAEYDNIR